MNAVDKLLADGLAEDVRKAILPGEIYVIGPNGLGGSLDNHGAAFKKIADRLRAAAPAGTRMLAWFCLKSDGTRVDGEIAIDVARGAPQIMWSIGKEDPQIDYLGSRSIRFPSSSEKLVAAAEPVEALLLVGTPHDEQTAELVRTLCYAPILPIDDRMAMSFERLQLEKVNA